MKAIFIFLCIFLVCKTNAQNVGIGTFTPSTTLEVKKALKSTVKISSNSFSDTSEIIFSNRTSANFGTDMQLTSIRELGIRVSSKSDLGANTVDTIMQITPIGNVGIRTATPAYPLDVKGDANITGELRANGVAGTEGQYLRSNGNGTMSWAGGEKYKNFKIFRNTGIAATAVSTFTVPVGVTDIAVEIWGGGAQGVIDGSGASGGYVYAQIPTTLHTSFTITVGAGGGCSGCTNTLGTSSTVVIPSGILTLTARGGYTTDFVASQGTFAATGTYLPNISYFGIDGEAAKICDIYYENSPLGYFAFYRNGRGGNAPLRPNTGGTAGWARANFGSAISVTNGAGKGSEPGGGGGAPNADGGHGQVIVYW